MMTSEHYKHKRYKREKFINKYLNGDGKVIDTFMVDNVHPNGAERHDITDNGLILVYNLKSGKLVTKLLAREHQIKRYYEYSGKEPPKEYKHVFQYLLSCLDTSYKTLDDCFSVLSSFDQIEICKRTTELFKGFKEEKNEEIKKLTKEIEELKKVYIDPKYLEKDVFKAIEKGDTLSVIHHVQHEIDHNIPLVSF